MQATIHLYETFSEALHTIQELEAAHVMPADISLIIKNGKSKRLTIELDPEEKASGSKSKKGKAAKAAAPKPVEDEPIDNDLKAQFFATLNLHDISGLGQIVGAGWIVADAIERTPQDDLGMTSSVPSGLIGCMVDNGLSQEHAETYIEGLKRGATLIGVKSANKMTAEVQRVMREEHRPLDPHMRGHHYWTSQASEVKDDRNSAANRMISMLISTVR